MYDTTQLLLTSVVRVFHLETRSRAVTEHARGAHPPICRVCRGTGWQPGEPITVQLDGRRVDEPTVQPCQHPWWWDDPSPDEPLSFDEYRARLAERARDGDSAAAAELALWAHWRRAVS